MTLGTWLERRYLWRLRWRWTVGPVCIRVPAYDLKSSASADSDQAPFSELSASCMVCTVMCGPRGLPGEPDHLFHNNGDGTFTDASVKNEITDPGHYYGFTAIFVDVNNDGKARLAVANDSEPNYL